MTRTMLLLIASIYIFVVLGAVTIGHTSAYYSDTERVSAVINIGNWESEDENCLSGNCGNCNNEGDREEYDMDCNGEADSGTKADDFSEIAAEESVIPEAAPDTFNQVNIGITSPSNDGEVEIGVKSVSDEELQKTVEGNERMEGGY